MAGLGRVGWGEEGLDRVGEVTISMTDTHIS